ncbi:uncharacterized protein LOC127849586 [Dreissena polymorpha]|uniref:Mab-21-like HhH/H2TH-like domain-containing protein n=1 Tax=Dreissena polymorpha TaxID=45954 RepID=A0A9D4D3B4_DREPO|nr:uncharacterized protein LOC127849586 [Dreissena polymorpha]XP_052238270.1 uncharacterized protein LOC127849586 [Dreissena polymorpha]XP_052238271.1 uncharacterized protein LOC127849586 [Dreissena polymorpha]XP_052238272.1 uncharacterized protein LOC127849586 [Dreissena polymorpha]KAH3737165.1 hypothetical protein DPMN_043744 [Dreissena polymorpha]
MADGGGFTEHGSVHSRQALFQYEHFSAETCTLMNCLGYGPQIRGARINAYKAYGRYLTAITRSQPTFITTGSKAEGLTGYLNGDTFITTGSKAEGITCPLESDIDLIRVTDTVICLEDGVDSSTIPAEINILRSCRRMSYHGHCILLLERYGTKIPIHMDDALCDDGYGRTLLSSDLYVNELLKRKPYEGEVQHERAGPSTPATIAGKWHRDLVLALHFYCPSILTRWATRPRNWPEPNIVQEVLSLGAFVTPVGYKGSAYEHVEWRMCFNSGENVLANNLNDTQVKLYILLKMVKKDVLKPSKKEVTSFTVKNIVLWIAENNPQSLFHDRSLLHWLHKGLDALRVAIIKLELPYYMIPERNLLAGCDLDYKQQRTWIATINDMIDEGPRVILRLPKIRQALIAHPEPLRRFSSWKIELEMLELICQNRIEKAVLFQAARARQKAILREVRQRMISEGGLVNDLDTMFDRILM